MNVWEGGTAASQNVFLRGNAPHWACLGGQAHPRSAENAANQSIRSSGPRDWPREGRLTPAGPVGGNPGPLRPLFGVGALEPGGIPPRIQATWKKTNPEAEGG